MKKNKPMYDLTHQLIIYGATLGDRIGCGEVKAQYLALNHRLDGIDLVRLATLAKDASDEIYSCFPCSW